MTDLDGWTKIEPLAAPKDRFVRLQLVGMAKGTFLSVKAVPALWPVLANRPDAFDAWRKGAQLRLAPAEDGAFRAKYFRGNAMRLRIAGWDGLDEPSDDEFFCAPAFDADDGALILTLPEGLFRNGRPRAVAAPRTPAGPERGFVDADPPASRRAADAGERMPQSTKDKLAKALR